MNYIASIVAAFKTLFFQIKNKKPVSNSRNGFVNNSNLVIMLRMEG